MVNQSVVYFRYFQFIQYSQLLRYASAIEVCIFIVGIIFNILLGATTPISFIIFSDIAVDFVSADGRNFQVIIARMLILASMALVVAYVGTMCLQYCARRQTKRIRHLYFSVGGVFFSQLNLYLFVS